MLEGRHKEGRVTTDGRAMLTFDMIFYVGQCLNQAQEVQMGVDVYAVWQTQKDQTPTRPRAFAVNDFMHYPLGDHLCVTFGMAVTAYRRTCLLLRPRVPGT